MQTPQPAPQLSQDDSAALCKSNPQQIQQLTQGLATCRSSTESQRATQLLFSVDDTMGFFTSQTAQFNDLMATGDKFLGAAPSSSALDEVRARNRELNTRVRKLGGQIEQSQARMEQMERDFLDVKATLPETLPNKIVHVLEDYTLAVLLLAYVFASLAVLFYYANVNQYSIKSILIGSVGVSTLGLFLYVLAMLFL
jgi:hypothetical protein